MVGLILAAGKGSRLSQSGQNEVCKALVEVGGVPLISYSLDNLVRLGVKSAVIVIGSHHRQIIDTLGDSYRGIKLQYVVQAQPIGLVSAILCAKETIRDDLVLQLSDEVFLQPASAEILLSAFKKADFLVGFTTSTEEKIRQNFSLDTDENDRLLHCTEKPKQVFNDRKGTGFCLFSKDCYELLKAVYDAESNQPNELCDFINFLIDNGKTGTAFPIAAEEININTPADLQYARRCVTQRG
ncbi:MAG: NTP transferase domain-containing protein [Clostridia bacterium]|nr:NTP transferase domain-containing protein [Clostridia bacterium]